MNEIQTNLTHESATPGNMNFFQRVTAVILSPGRVMEKLTEKPGILFPLIMIAVSRLILYFTRLPLYQDYLRMTTQATARFTESLTGMKLTPEMIEKAVSRSTSQIFYTLPIGSLFGWLLLTVIFFAIFKILRGQGKFKQYLSVIGYSYTIMAISMLLTLVVSFFTGSLYLDVSLTSIANFFSSDLKGSFIYGMLKGMDVFSIWYYSVIAIGLSTVSGLKKRTVYCVVAGIFVIGLLIAGASEAALGAMI